LYINDGFKEQKRVIRDMAKYREEVFIGGEKEVIEAHLLPIVSACHGKKEGAAAITITRTLLRQCTNLEGALSLLCINQDEMNYQVSKASECILSHDEG